MKCGVERGEGGGGGVEVYSQGFRPQFPAELFPWNSSIPTATENFNFFSEIFT